MNIKTITCHHVYNYGATLQAYALQEYLESLGHNVEIIDYRLPTHMRYELFTPYPQGRVYNIIKIIPLLKYILCPLKNRKMLLTWGRKKSFDNFDKKFLRISAKTYHSISEIQADPPLADVYIAGSDQIWNTAALNGKDPGYYLDFGNKKTKRISYAASFGVSKISADYEGFVKEKLLNFDSISVREKSGLEILNKLDIKGTVVVDPVFLLSKQQWIEKLGLKEMHENYIFLYDFLHDDASIRDFALSLSKETGAPLWSVNDFGSTPYADKQINNAGPIEFLQYLLNAKFVVSNSFHASAFSLIFQKEFVTFPLVSQCNSSRMSDLLSTLDLTYRLLPLKIDVLRKNIDWQNINNKMSTSVLTSKHFLNINLK